MHAKDRDTFLMLKFFCHDIKYEFYFPYAALLSLKVDRSIAHLEKCPTKLEQWIFNYILKWEEKKKKGFSSELLQIHDVAASSLQEWLNLLVKGNIYWLFSPTH